MAETRSTHLSKRIWNISKYVLAILLVWFVFSKTSFADIVDLFKHISLPWLGVSFVLFFLMTMMKTVQYHLLSGRQTPYARLLSIVVIQNAITNFIATGAGIASYLTMFTVDEGVRLRRAAATFMIAKIGDLIVVWLLLLISSIFVWGQIFSLGIATLVILTVIPLSICAFAALVILRQKFVSAIRALAYKLHLERFSFTQRGLDVLQFLAEQDGGMILRLIQIAIVCSSIYMVLTLLWVFASLRAFSLIVPAPVLVFVNAWIQLISWLPIQVFGGLGVSETSQVYLYGLFGIPVLQMATVSIGLRVSSYLFNLVSLLYVPFQNLFHRKNLQVQSSNERSE
jgi:uncharacterized membrane protein YbhN (UPF0104 family)